MGAFSRKDQLDGGGFYIPGCRWKKGKNCKRGGATPLNLGGRPAQQNKKVLGIGDGKKEGDAKGKLKGKTEK